MIDSNEYGWGLAQYSGKVKVSFSYKGQDYSFDVRITPSKLDLRYYQWMFVIPGSRHRFALCGRYFAGWDPDKQDYEYPARLKFQEISTRYCYISVLERDTIQGHGYIYTDTITDVTVR